MQEKGTILDEWIEVPKKTTNHNFVVSQKGLYSMPYIRHGSNDCAYSRTHEACRGFEKLTASQVDR